MGTDKNKKQAKEEPIVKPSDFLRRLIHGDNPEGGGAATLRNLVVWLFIALVATFLTIPTDPPSIFDKPLPMPAEIGLK